MIRTCPEESICQGVGTAEVKRGSKDIPIASSLDVKPCRKSGYGDGLAAL